MMRQLQVLTSAGLFLALAAGAASAAECQTFGKEPFCGGKCPSGWYLSHTASNECSSGTKVVCCKARQYPIFGDKPYKPSTGQGGSQSGNDKRLKSCARACKGCYNKKPTADECSQGFAGCVKACMR